MPLVFRVLLALGLFAVLAAVPARAQVVIEEEVEVEKAPATSLPAEASSPAATQARSDSYVYSNGHYGVAPGSGRLIFRYNQIKTVGEPLVNPAFVYEIRSESGQKRVVREAIDPSLNSTYTKADTVAFCNRGETVYLYEGGISDSVRVGEGDKIFFYFVNGGNKRTLIGQWGWDERWSEQEQHFEYVLYDYGDEPGGLFWYQDPDCEFKHPDNILFSVTANRLAIRRELAKIEVRGPDAIFPIPKGDSASIGVLPKEEDDHVVHIGGGRSFNVFLDETAARHGELVAEDGRKGDVLRNVPYRGMDGGAFSLDELRYVTTSEDTAIVLNPRSATVTVELAGAPEIADTGRFTVGGNTFDIDVEPDTLAYGTQVGQVTVTAVTGDGEEVYLPPDTRFQYLEAWRHTLIGPEGNELGDYVEGLTYEVLRSGQIGLRLTDEWLLEKLREEGPVSEWPELVWAAYELVPPTKDHPEAPDAFYPSGRGEVYARLNSFTVEVQPQQNVVAEGDRAAVRARIFDSSGEEISRAEAREKNVRLDLYVTEGPGWAKLRAFGGKKDALQNVPFEDLRGTAYFLYPGGPKLDNLASDSTVTIELVAELSGIPSISGSASLEITKGLDMKRWAQGDDRWSELTYDHTSSDIGTLGCALSSSAAIATTLLNEEITPKELNDWMKTWTNPETGERERRPFSHGPEDENKGGFWRTGGMNWWAMEVYTNDRLNVIGRKGSRLRLAGNYQWNKAQAPSKLDKHLEEGRIIAVQVFNAQSRSRGTTGQHWVTVYGKTKGGRYRIADPGRGEQYLDAYREGGVQSSYGNNRFWGYVPVERVNQ